MADPSLEIAAGTADVPCRAKSLRRCFSPMTPWTATGMGHGIFICLTFLMLRAQWWRGDILADCENASVAAHCVCRPTFEFICWLSECINGTYGGQNAEIVWQSRVWVALALVPAMSGVWLLFNRRRKLDVVLGMLSWVYLLVGLLPDTFWFLDRNVLGVGHFVFAGLGLLSGFVMQFFLPRYGVVFSLPLYVCFFVVICEMLIADGAERSKIYDFHGPFLVLILEWTGVLGAAATAVVYCATEEFHSRRVILLAPPTDTPAGNFHIIC